MGRRPVVVVDTFSAAARALYTVQSNVSSHIARLEKELADDDARVVRTEGARGEDELATLVTRDSMIGTGNARSPAGTAT